MRSIALGVAALLMWSTVQAGSSPPIQVREYLALMGYLDEPVADQGEEEVSIAIEDFQAATGHPITGELSNDQFELLEEKAAYAEGILGFRIVVDTEMGIRYGYPADLLTVSEKSIGRLRYQTQDGSAVLEIYSSVLPVDEMNLRLLQLQRENIITEVESTETDVFIRGHNQREHFQTHVFNNGRGKSAGYTLIYPIGQSELYTDVARFIGNSFNIQDTSPAVEAPLVEILKAIPRVETVKAAMSPVEFYKAVSHSVFTVTPMVFNSTSQNPLTSGSGVAITENRILTSCHVVSGWAEADIIRADEIIASGEIIAADHISDICVLEAEGSPFTPVGGIRTYESLEIGETVYTLGSPAGFEGSLSDGIISGLRRPHDSRWVQTTAVVARGSSGGGLFDADGNLIGLMSFIVSASRELNFAVSVDRIADPDSSSQTR